MQENQLEVMMTTVDFLANKTAKEIMQEFDGMIYYAFATDQHLDLLFELSLKQFPVVVLDKKIYELPFQLSFQIISKVVLWLRLI